MRSSAAGDPAPQASLGTLRQALASRFARVAITHEWLTIPGGSETVVRALLDLLPQAELFTTVFAPDAFPWLEGRTVRPSGLDRLPGARRQYPRLLPLMDGAWRRLDLTGFDLVVSSSHACAKNVRPPAGTVHVSYCHTPIRYVWDPALLEGEQMGRLGGAAFRVALPHLRRADLRGVGGVDRFVANSTLVAERIARCYGRGSDVVHPPVAVAESLGRPRRAGPDAPYLVFGRVVPYKRVDHAVRACRALGRRLVVAGDGRDLERVRALAGPETTFVGRVDDAERDELMATSRALLFPAEEDFGIVPVEAQAAGLPVVGLSTSGIRDSVRDGVSGVLYGEATAEGLTGAIRRFETLALDDGDVRDQARPFAPERFAQAITQVLLDVRAGERTPAGHG